MVIPGRVSIYKKSVEFNRVLDGIAQPRALSSRDQAKIILVGGQTSLPVNMCLGKRFNRCPYWLFGRSREREMQGFLGSRTLQPRGLAKIKNEAATWASVGANDLETLLLRD